jgi:PKD repeat protein
MCKNIFSFLIVGILLSSCKKDVVDEAAQETSLIKLRAGFIPVTNADRNTKTVTLHNVSQRDSSILWNFGDGNTSTVRLNEYTYETSGTYVITLSVSDGVMMDTYADTIRIIEQPNDTLSFANGNATASDSRFCKGNSVTLDVIYPEPLDSIKWFLDGNVFASSKTVTNLSLGVGYHDVGLHLYLNEDSVLEYFVNDLLQVMPNPIGDFSSLSTKLNASFFNETVNSISFYWSFGDGYVSKETAPQHIYEMPGEYEVMLISRSSYGCHNIFKKSITIVE